MILGLSLGLILGCNSWSYAQTDSGSDSGSHSRFYFGSDSGFNSWSHCESDSRSHSGFDFYCDPFSNSGFWALILNLILGLDASSDFGSDSLFLWV